MSEEAAPSHTFLLDGEVVPVYVVVDVRMVEVEDKVVVEVVGCSVDVEDEVEVNVEVVEDKVDVVADVPVDVVDVIGVVVKSVVVEVGIDPL